MNKIILVGVAALLLLFAGCVNLPGATSQKGNETTGQAAGEQTAGTVEETVEKTIGNLEDAVMQNVPLECVATETVDGGAVTIHYWIKDGNVRTESEAGGQKTVTILKNKMVYLGTDALTEELPEGIECDWIVFKQDDEEKPEMGAYSLSMDNYENMANVKVDCNPGAFGNEKFETVGRVCSMTDLIPPANNLPAGYEECEGLSGQALIDCMMQR